MQEKPTTFQLAQLAAQAAPSNSAPKDAVKRAWALWRESEAEIAEHENRAEFLRGLFKTPDGKDIPIFTDTPADWQARLKAYPGDSRDVDKALWDQEFANEEVQKQLFKDKSLARATRQILFLGLIRVAILADMPGPLVSGRGQLTYLGSGNMIEEQPGFPIHPKNVQLAEQHNGGNRQKQVVEIEVKFVRTVETLLSQPRLYAHLVRWLVEVRQPQLARSKTRVIPQSIRKQRREHDADENIQYKPAHRA